MSKVEKLEEQIFLPWKKNKKKKILTRTKNGERGGEKGFYWMAPHINVIINT